MAEKYQETVDKQSDRQVANLSKQMMETEKTNMQDVVKVSKGEMGIVERDKRLETSQQNKKEKKKKRKINQKLFDKETGLLLDIEG